MATNLTGHTAACYLRCLWSTIRRKLVFPGTQRPANSHMLRNALALSGILINFLNITAGGLLQRSA